MLQSTLVSQSWPLSGRGSLHRRQGVCPISGGVCPISRTSAMKLALKASLPPSSPSLPSLIRIRLTLCLEPRVEVEVG